MESNINKLGINFFEYCVVEEDTRLPTNTIKVRIPKLTTSTSKGRVYPKSTILINDNDCKPKTSGSILLSEGLIIKTFSALELSKSAKHVRDSEGNIIYSYLPKGSRMIVCFMENNVNDGYLTNML